MFSNQMDIVHRMNHEPCELYKLLAPLYFVDPVVVDSQQIDEKRQQVLKYMKDCIPSRPVKHVPKSFLSLRPPHFQYAYHNRNDIKLFQEMSTFYRAALGWDDKLDRGRKRLQPRDRINVAFVSNMFSKLSSVLRDRQGTIKHLSRDEFFVSIVVFDKPRDDYAERLYHSADRVLILNRKEKDQVEWMKRFNFDVIVYDDLNMCGETMALSHYRLAPVQINTWGHSDTSGISTIDYYVSSKLYEVEDEAQDHYSEKLVLHEGLCTCYDRPIVPSSIHFLPRSYFGLPSSAVVYLCYQSLFKVSPEFQGVVKKIVQADPKNVVVFIKGFIGDQEQVQFYKAMEALVGYPFINQIRILERQDFVKINNLVHVSDVALDTFPFGGCNTTLECFNMGKPVVTLPSSHINGRFTYGFYKTLGIDEFIATNVDDYVSKALNLGSDAAYREKWSRLIQERSSMLWNDMSSVKEWEHTLSTLTKPHVRRVNMLEHVSFLLPCPVQITGKNQITTYTDNKNAIAKLLLENGFVIEKNKDRVQFIDGVWAIVVDPSL